MFPRKSLNSTKMHQISHWSGSKAVGNTKLQEDYYKTIAMTQFTESLLNALLKVYKISANVVMFKV